MNDELIKKYKKLKEKYPNLCFKVYDESLNQYLLFITTNDGFIKYSVDEDLYLKTDIKTIDKNCLSLIDFNSRQGKDNSLDDLKLDDVEVFLSTRVFFDGGFTRRLILYLGNNKDIIIPSNIQSIGEEAFSYNDNIETIKGESIDDIKYLHNIKNLKRVEFNNLNPECIVSRSIFRENINNLKNINFKNFKVSIEKEKIIINYKNKVSKYLYDDNLIDNIYKSSLVKEEGINTKEEKSFLFIKGNDKRFKFAKKDFNTFLDVMCFFEIEYEDKYNFIKNMLDEDEHKFIVGNLYDTISDNSYGFFIPPVKLIAYRPENFRDVFWHEVGHAVDYALGEISLGKVFSKIYYNAEEMLLGDINNKTEDINKNQIDNNRKKKKEFFAFCCENYFKSEDNIDRYKINFLCPEACTFVNNVFSYIKDLYNNKTNENIKQKKL